MDNPFTKNGIVPNIKSSSNVTIWFTVIIIICVLILFGLVFYAIFKPSVVKVSQPNPTFDSITVTGDGTFGNIIIGGAGKTIRGIEVKSILKSDPLQLFTVNGDSVFNGDVFANNYYVQQNGGAIGTVYDSVYNPVPAGDIGPTGAQGLQGLQGVQGIPGLATNTGATGSQGIQGVQGIQGLKGDQGIQGIPGLATNTGATGPSGGLIIPGSTYGNYLYWNGVDWTVGMGNITIGDSAGEVSQGDSSIALGYHAGQTNQGGDSIALGDGAGQNNQGPNSIALGPAAGQNNQGDQSIALGPAAGNSNQGDNSIAIGNGAGQNYQGDDSIAMGYLAGYTGQGINSVALGYLAGQNYQGNDSFALGFRAGNTNQGDASIALGDGAGQNNQGPNSIALGPAAGNSNQGNESISIGNTAGQTNQGNNSIAIGNQAGVTNQAAQSIILNALGEPLNASTDGFFVAPIRNDDTQTTQLAYNPTTNEIVYKNSALSAMSAPIPTLMKFFSMGYYNKTNTEIIDEDVDDGTDTYDASEYVVNVVGFQNKGSASISGVQVMTYIDTLTNKWKLFMKSVNGTTIDNASVNLLAIPTSMVTTVGTPLLPSDPSISVNVVTVA
jgi:hypothetical protein